MKLTSKLCLIACLAPISTLALASKITLVNDSACYITDQGVKANQPSADLYSYTMGNPNDANSIVQDQHLAPTGQAELLKDDDGEIGVLVGEPNKKNLTFNDDDGSQTYILTDIAVNDGCASDSPCYVVEPQDLCSGAAMTASKRSFKKL